MFYVRLFGHVLGHADFDHFLGNMLLLLVIGPPLEEKYGSRTLLAGILLTAGVSGILQCVFFPGSALLGASGIVFMLIMLASLAGMKDGRIPLTLILAAVLLALTNWVKPTKNLHPIVFIAASAVVGVVFRFAGV